MKKDKKTEKTVLQVNWPSSEEFWTVKDLHQKNPQFTAEITLRVRLQKAIHETHIVEMIGEKMNPKGRPQMICVTKMEDGSVNPAAVEAARKADIRLNDEYVEKINLNPTAAHIEQAVDFLKTVEVPA